MVAASRRSVRVAVLLATGLIAPWLTGCADAPVELPTESPSASPAPTATAGPDEEPDDLPAVELACDELVSPDTIYAFNPNFVSIAEWRPAPGSPAEAALDAGGVACRWQNQTSGDVIDVAVAAYDEETLDGLKNEAFEQSTMVPTYGVEGYFSVADGVGTAIAFDRVYRVVAQSPAFLEPGEATDIVADALQALP